MPQSSKASVSEEIASGRASVSQRPRAQDDVEGALMRAQEGSLLAAAAQHH